MEEEENNSMDTNELKILGLKQAISERFSEYEERIVDLRVELTQMSEENMRLSNELAEANEKLANCQSNEGKDS